MGVGHVLLTALLGLAGGFLPHSVPVQPAVSTAPDWRGVARAPPPVAFSIRNSGMEKKIGRRWNRELRRRKSNSSMLVFMVSEPFALLGDRARSAPERWIERWTFLREMFWPSLEEEEPFQPLPDGYQEFIDPASGIPYYVGPDGVSSWERPSPPPPALAAVAAPPYDAYTAAGPSAPPSASTSSSSPSISEPLSPLGLTSASLSNTCLALKSTASSSFVENPGTPSYSVD